MRGEGAHVADVHRDIRITPACAGRRPFSKTSSEFRRDHPRVCGEKGVISPLASSDRGSPPRVRGEGLRPELVVKEDRITPACAGRSQQNEIIHLPPLDHPRVCGEKYIRDTAGGSDAGSPPRVRGEAENRLCQPPEAGITPACAGRRLKRSPI